MPLTAQGWTVGAARSRANVVSGPCRQRRRTGTHVRYGSWSTTEYRAPRRTGLRGHRARRMDSTRTPARNAYGGIGPVSASSDYRSRTMSGTRNGMAMETDWFGGGYPPGYHAQQVFAATAVAERPVEISTTSAFTVTTADVLDVLGPDADDVLATANLDV